MDKAQIISQWTSNRILSPLLIFGIIVLHYSCNVDRHNIIQNPIQQLNPRVKKIYQDLSQILDEKKRKELETLCKSDEDPTILQEVIQKMYDTQLEYLTLISILPKEQRKSLQNDAENNSLEKLHTILHGTHHPDYELQLQKWNALPKDTQSKYLLLINSQQKQTKQAVKKIKETYFGKQSPDKIDTAEMDQDIDRVLKPIEQVLQQSLSTSSLLPEQGPDSSTQTVLKMYKKKQKHWWTGKLRFSEENSAKFANLLSSLMTDENNVLKKLLPQVDEISLGIFALAIYNDAFTEEERQTLLQALVTIYEKNCALALKICNNPCDLTPGEQFSILRKTTRPQLKALLKLNDVVTSLPDEEIMDYLSTYYGYEKNPKSCN